MKTLLSVLVVGVFISGTSAGVQSERVYDTYKTHPCIRKCLANQPMNCTYDFTAEYYFVLNKACYDCPSNKTDCYRPHCVPADGTQRGVLVVNRMLPGPGIQVCEGDRVIVRVHNELVGAEGTTIHWHGILQHGSQHMDGVSMVTQCPINAKSSFEYRFNADNAGTHFWHAHSGLQRSDGLFGALVVRQADEHEPHLGLYEEDRPDHVMLVHDWLVELSVNRFAHHHHAGGDNKPRSMLINGHGVLQDFFDSTDNTTSFTPLEVFHVTKGKRYRFRVISNGILNCPIQISIDDHMLTMITSDGNAFEKEVVHSFNIFAGERFDFVLDANMTAGGNFWIRARGHLDCGVKKAKQVAILRYDGAPEEDPAGTTTWEDAARAGRLLNPYNAKSSDELISIADLVAKEPASSPEALRATPDKKFYLYMDFNKIDNFHFHDVAYYPISALERPQHLYMPQMNHITNNLPSAPPLTQLNDLDEEEVFCNEDNLDGKNCSAVFCQCAHRLQVALGDVVELVIIDEGVTFNANHPMHLHGYKFYVVGMDRLGESTSVEDVKRLDAEGRLPRNLTHAVLKDTVTVNDGGYSILRFHAKNPGVWFFHCHIEFHADIGMGLLIQVGEKKDFPRVPKSFPRCGSWSHNEAEDNNEEENNQTCAASAIAQSWSIAVVIAVFIFSVSV